jgi:adenine C2-methylase RlmN of 23S rRNA A2503 and tRNA A37
LRSQESKYLRNLTAREIVDQCWNVAREMDFSSGKPLLFSFMGEGEPFLNFEACTDAFLHLVMIGWPVPIRLAVSTSGIRPDLITELGNLKFLVPLKLQISLHGPTDEVRRKIVPHTSPLADILAAVRSYPLTDGRTVEVNDAPEHAHALVELLGPGWHVKFNHLNLAVNSPFQPSPAENVSRFRDILHAGGITTECYFTDESSISSGCGQLSYSRVEALALR